MKLRLLLFTAILSFTLSADDRDSGPTIPVVAENNKLSPLLSDDEKRYVEQSKTLIVCSVAQAIGSNASAELVSLLTRETGLKIKASPSMAWEEGLNGLQNKTCDVLPWATFSPERSIRMNFTQPYARIIRVIVTRHEQSYITDISQVGDKQFVTEKDNIVVDQLKTFYPNLQTTRVEHTSDALDMVLEGKVFASIASLYSVSNLFNSSELKDLKIAGRLPAAFDDVVALATRKEDRILSQILDKSVQKTNPKLVKDFMSQGAIFTYEPEIDYQKFWVYGLGTIFLFVLLIGWNRRLKDLNSRLENAHSDLKAKTFELEILSITDSLTKIFNRLKIDRIFSEEIRRSERYLHPLSTIMVDIDHFKQINDTYGHLVGDKILTEVAQLLKNNIRSNDFLGRWGGEEFLIICPSTQLQDAVMVAEKLRAMIYLEDFSPAEKITASFGVAQWQKGDSQESVVAKADYAMYLSKHQGRNCVNSSDQTEPD